MLKGHGLSSSLAAEDHLVPELSQKFSIQYLYDA